MTDKQQNHNSLIVRGFQIIVQFIQTPLTQRNNWHDNNYNTGDKIANVNLFTTLLYTYFKIPKKRTYFV